MKLGTPQQQWVLYICKARFYIYQIKLLFLIVFKCYFLDSVTIPNIIFSKINIYTICKEMSAPKQRCHTFEPTQICSQKTFYLYIVNHSWSTEHPLRRCSADESIFLKRDNNDIHLPFLLFNFKQLSCVSQAAVIWRDTE